MILGRNNGVKTLSRERRLLLCPGEARSLPLCPWEACRLPLRPRERSPYPLSPRVTRRTRPPSSLALVGAPPLRSCHRRCPPSVPGTGAEPFLSQGEALSSLRPQQMRRPLRPARGRFLVAKRMSQTLQKIAKNETARSTDSLNDKTGVHLESRRFDVIIETWAVGYGGWTLVARPLSASRRC